MSWKVLSEFVKIKSPWLTLVGEILQTEDKSQLEYWRVEKPDGVIVITLQSNRLVLPKAMFRPGIGRYTLDFCGGRISDKEDLKGAARRTVKREFKLHEPNPFLSLTKINKEGWEVDSSFTNVKLNGYIAELKPGIIIRAENIGGSYPVNAEGIDKLMHDLSCLQCRAVFWEWLATVDINT